MIKVHMSPFIGTKNNCNMQRLRNKFPQEKTLSCREEPDYLRNARNVMKLNQSYHSPQGSYPKTCASKANSGDPCRSQQTIQHSTRDSMLPLAPPIVQKLGSYISSENGDTACQSYGVLL
jgi:hypothetical protein